MRKSILKKISAVFCAVALTVAMGSECFAADRWVAWIGQNENWYEGGLGELKSQSENSWTVALDQIGWGGVWGAQIKDEKLSLDKGVEYQISFDLTSDTIDKWVFIKVANDNDDLLFGEWIQLKTGKKTSYSKKFTLSEKATKVVFGVGGEFGDRTDEKEMYDLISSLPTDVDASYSTTITCNNFSLEKAGGETADTDKSEESDSKTSSSAASSNTSAGTSQTTTSTSTAVKTGDFTPISCAAVAVAAAAVIVVFTRKRQDV